MRIAIIGSGAREDALRHTFEKEGHSVWVLPGNAASSKSLAVETDDFTKIEKFCKDENIDLVLAGQEKSLALGLQNKLSKKGLCVFGPSREASRLESSKIWAKKFMDRNGVNTAPYAIVETTAEAEAIISQWGGDCVIKWDGLAAGKGVAVCKGEAEANAALSHFLSKFSSTEFVFERRLTGREISIFVVTNGDQYKFLAPAQDYKRLYEGDKGPNTGGMGAVSADSLLSSAMKKKIEEKIIEPTMKGLKKENIPYMGFLYFGILISEEEPYLLEYNVRLGDPETSVILPRLKTPLLDVVVSCLEMSLDKLKLEVSEEACVTVVMASSGYPEKPCVGEKIYGLEDLNKDDLLFHAGTRKEGVSTISTGGRVLNCSALGSTVEEAKLKAYSLCKKINFHSSFYRHDIGEGCIEKKDCNSHIGDRF